MALSREVLNFVANTGGTTTTVNTSFLPKALILVSHFKTTEGESATARYSFGVSDSTNHRCIGWAGDDAAATSNVIGGFRTDAALEIYIDGATVAQRVTGVAFNSGNFVLTWSGTPASAWEISAIVFGGDDPTNISVGSIAMPTSIQVQNVTTVGFQGDFGLFFHGGRTTSGFSTNPKQSLGAAISPTKRWVMDLVVRDAQTTSAAVNAMSTVDDTAILEGHAASTNALEFLGDFDGFTADGFNIDWTTVPASAYLYAWLIIKGGQWDLGISTKPAGATTQTVTGMAFTPTLVSWAMSSATALATSTSEATSTVGVWDGTTEIYAGAYHNDAINTVAKSAGASTKVLRELNYTAEADGTSLNSDGWTITWTDTGTAYLVPWWAAASSGAAPPPPPAFGDYAGQFKIIRPTLW